MSNQKTLNDHIKIALETFNSEKFICEIIDSIPVEIMVTNSAFEWISRYKTDYKKNIYNQFSKLKNSRVQIEEYLVIKYFYEWVIQKDFVPSLPALPHRINNVLNIGAGVGLFDIYLKGLFPDVSLNFIELEEEYDEITHFDMRLEKLEGKINAIFLLKENLNKNNLKKTKIFTPLEVRKIKESSIDLVLSFRSWSYLYPVETYSDLVNKILTSNGKIICDVLKNNYKDFSRTFNIIEDIGKAGSLIRVLAEKK